MVTSMIIHAPLWPCFSIYLVYNTEEMPSGIPPG